MGRSILAGATDGSLKVGARCRLNFALSVVLTPKAFSRMIGGSWSIVSIRVLILFVSKVAMKVGWLGEVSQSMSKSQQRAFGLMNVSTRVGTCTIPTVDTPTHTHKG